MLCGAVWLIRPHRAADCCIIRPREVEGCHRSSPSQVRRSCPTVAAGMSQLPTRTDPRSPAWRWERPCWRWMEDETVNLGFTELFPSRRDLSGAAGCREIAARLGQAVVEFHDAWNTYVPFPPIMYCSEDVEHIAPSASSRRMRATLAMIVQQLGFKFQVHRLI